MLVSKKFGFVFLCTPKNASNSVEDMLKPFCEISFLGGPEIRHTTMSEYAEFIKPYLDLKTEKSRSYETICIVREPVSWLYSWYRFRSRGNLRNPSNNKHNKSTAKVTFEEFVQAYLSDNQPEFAQVGSQYEFVLGQAGAVDVDRIFKYEDMGSFVKYMEEKVGSELTLPIKNVSPNKVYDNMFIARLAGSDIFAKIKSKLVGKSVVVPKTSPHEYLSEVTLKQLKRKYSSDFKLYDRINTRQV